MYNLCQEKRENEITISQILDPGCERVNVSASFVRKAVPAPLKAALCVIVPVLLACLCPLGMTVQQSFVLGGLIMVIIWWSTGWVGKITASCILLAVFLFVGRAPAATVFSFPLSDSFLLIIFCYLFSRGIENAHIAEKTFGPLLFRFAATPVRMMIAVILFFTVTVYVIPQPLARLIILANIVRAHLKKTDAPESAQSVLLFSVFLFYVIVNMGAMDADIILNTSSVGFAGLSMTNGEWMQYMLVPTAIYIVAVLVLFCAVFRKELRGVRLTPREASSGEKASFTPQEKKVIAVVLGTVILWMTSGWHGINPTYITLAGTVLLFAMRVLRKKDFSAIDVTTMVFLTAAFCIGGVLKYTGVADVIFSRIGRMFPAQFGFLYLLVVILITMCMHLVLGSNTTTLSVVLPALMTICGGVMPAQEILFIAYISLTAHFLLPFHAVSLMIGAGNGYFPSSYAPRFGLPMMLFIIAGIFVIFLPYWSLTGLI